MVCYRLHHALLLKLARACLLARALSTGRAKLRVFGVFNLIFR